MEGSINTQPTRGSLSCAEICAHGHDNVAGNSGYIWATESLGHICSKWNSTAKIISSTPPSVNAEVCAVASRARCGALPQVRQEARSARGESRAPILFRVATQQRGRPGVITGRPHGGGKRCPTSAREIEPRAVAPRAACDRGIPDATNHSRWSPSRVITTTVSSASDGPVTPTKRTTRSTFQFAVRCRPGQQRFARVRTGPQ